MLLTTTEVALRLGCSAENDRRLERVGELKAERTAKGRRIFNSESVDLLIIERAKTREMKEAARAA